MLLQKILNKGMTRHCTLTHSLDEDAMESGGVKDSWKEYAEMSYEKDSQINET